MKVRIVKLDATPLYRRVDKSRVYKESGTKEIDIDEQVIVEKLREADCLQYGTHALSVIIIGEYLQGALNGK